MAAVTDRSGNVWAFRFGSQAVVPAGGAVTAASAAQNMYGDTYVAGIASEGSLWLNVFKASETWTGWVSPGGPKFVSGLSRPAIAIASDGTAWIAALGASQGQKQQYWLTAYRPARGFDEWTPLGTGFFLHNFGSPLLVLTNDGKVYVVGTGQSREDDTETITAGAYVPGSGFTGWSVAPRAVASFRRSDVSSAAAGSDGSAYVAAMDTSGAVWMSRFSDAGWGDWYTVPGIFNSAGGTDSGPKLAAGSGRVFAVGLDPNGGVWINSFVEGTGNGWGTWTYANGVLASFAPAVVQNNLSIAGQSRDSTLWWYSTATGWNPYGQVSTYSSNSPLTAAPH